jgi:DNA-binding transcriptional LysR family regulator
VVELGVSIIDVARRFDMTPAAVSYSVQRGEKMAGKEGYQVEN